MDYDFEKNTITVFGKSEKISTLTLRLSSLSGTQVYSFFDNRGIMLPRRINCMAMVSVINERLKTLHASELSKDYFQRLKYYASFSEVQLVNLFKQICTSKEEFKQYRINLFQLILLNHVSLNLTDGEIKYLKDLKKLPTESFEEYVQYISSVSQEQENTFDGQDLQILKDTLLYSASSAEILELGKKYELAVSSKLKKNELAEYIQYYLVKNGQWTAEKEEEVGVSTLVGLNALCKKYRIPMSSNLTKSEAITYLFYILEQYEIISTSIKRLESLPMYEPLEFTVDMSAFKGFRCDDTKRIIRYANEENDEFPMLEVIPLSDSREAEALVITEVEAQEAEEVKEAVILEVSQHESSVPEELEDENEVTAIDTELSLDTSAELTDDEAEIESEVEETEPEPSQTEMETDFSEIEEATPESEAVVSENMILVEAEATSEQILEEPAKSDAIPQEIPSESTGNTVDELSLDDVEENSEFGNEKIMKWTKGPGKWIAAILSGCIVLTVIGFVIWALVK